jgi:hypothetical protein
MGRRKYSTCLESIVEWTVWGPKHTFWPRHNLCSALTHFSNTSTPAEWQNRQTLWRDCLRERTDHDHGST